MASSSSSLKDEAPWSILSFSKLMEKRFSQVEIKCLSSPTGRDSVALKKGENLMFNRQGADFLY